MLTMKQSQGNHEGSAANKIIQNQQEMENTSITKFHMEFLKSDFDQSYQQLRHYDSLNWDITKFSFIQLLLSVSAIWGLYSFSQDTKNSHSFVTDNFNLIVPTIIGGSYVFSLLASFLISRNRVYFAKTARYLNEHRKFSLSQNPAGFKNYTKFYTNLNFPNAFNIWSTHLVCLYVIQIVSSVYFGITTFYILTNKGLLGNWKLEFSILLGLIAMISSLIFLIKYLKNQDTKFGK